MADQLALIRDKLKDSYTIHRELGRGGMSSVFLATDLRHDRSVALKVLKPELAGVIGTDRYLREIKTTARLTHPHILPLLDSGEAGGMLYYVMPFITGESLRDRLKQEKQLSIDEALRITREVADALNYAHTRGVVHRDIKPENILLDSGHAVVADFGISLAIDQAGGDTLTATGMTIGTTAYMSPEQATGSKELDGRSDIYSLGCVLYEMLAGHPPFTASSTESLVFQRLTADPPSITSIRPSVPLHVAAALERALSKTPADRFHPASLFAEALGQHPATMASGPLPLTRHFPRRPSWWQALRLGIAALAGAAIIAVIAVKIGVRPGPEKPDPATMYARTAIAVLPFRNLSAQGPHAYFAGGLHEELLTQLAKVPALSVRGRSSVMGYAETSKPIQEIAGELSVGAVVEGSVQVVGKRLRVNVQLIDTATDVHLWAERYDRTLDDAFGVQSDIAQQIVAAVGMTLPGPVANAISIAPTQNAEAYRLYLQGMEYLGRPGRFRDNQENAQHFFERALEKDDEFALAHAALSMTHGGMSWLRYDTSPERLEAQLYAAETALRLAPGLPQAHIAMGLVHYFARRDWQAALDEYRIALKGLPNDAALWARVGFVHRRLGDWAGVEEALAMATQLDPRSSGLWEDLAGGTFTLTRRYPEAIDAYNRALKLAPDFHLAAAQKGLVYRLWLGVSDTLRTALETFLPDTELGPQGTVRALRAELLLLDRKPGDLLFLLRNSRLAVFESQDFYFPASLYAGWAHRLNGDEQSARVSFTSALAVLDSVIEVAADDWRIRASRGLALAGLGQSEAALHEARWLEQSDVYRRDAFLGPRLMDIRGKVLAQVGETGEALLEVEKLLSRPSWISSHMMHLDPRWDMIRGEPQFQSLLATYTEPSPAP